MDTTDSMEDTILDTGESLSHQNNNPDNNTPTKGPKRTAKRRRLTPVENLKFDDGKDRPPKKQKVETVVELPKITEHGEDVYCWYCHRSAISYGCRCSSCKKVYHPKCLGFPSTKDVVDKSWVCPQCDDIINSESPEEKLKPGYVDRIALNDLLLFTLKRIYLYPGYKHFLNPVDITEHADYLEYIAKPMDLTIIKKKMQTHSYKSSERFLMDIKYLLHNSYIYNSSTSKLTSTARNLLRIAKQECVEIHNCKDCYRHAHMLPDSWFIEPCKKPHILVWARLKGYPYWPGKVMKVVDGEADVRFFGDHNRSMVSLANVYLYSPKIPSTRGNLSTHWKIAVEEMELHIEKLKKVHGIFQYAPQKTQLDPALEIEQIKIHLPNFKLRKAPKPRSSAQQKNQPKVNKKKSTKQAKVENTVNTSAKVDTSTREDLIDNTCTASTSNEIDSEIKASKDTQGTSNEISSEIKASQDTKVNENTDVCTKNQELDKVLPPVKIQKINGETTIEKVSEPGSMIQKDNIRSISKPEVSLFTIGKHKNSENDPPKSYSISSQSLNNKIEKSLENLTVTRIVAKDKLVLNSDVFKKLERQCATEVPTVPHEDYVSLSHMNLRIPDSLTFKLNGSFPNKIQTNEIITNKEQCSSKDILSKQPMVIIEKISHLPNENSELTRSDSYESLEELVEIKSERGTPSPELRIESVQSTPAMELGPESERCTQDPIMIPESIISTPSSESQPIRSTSSPELRTNSKRCTPSPELRPPSPELRPPSPELRLPSPELGTEIVLCTPSQELRRETPQGSPNTELRIETPRCTTSPELTRETPQGSPNPELVIDTSRCTTSPELTRETPLGSPNPELVIETPRCTTSPGLRVEETFGAYILNPELVESEQQFDEQLLSPNDDQELNFELSNDENKQNIPESMISRLLTPNEMNAVRQTTMEIFQEKDIQQTNQVLEVQGNGEDCGDEIYEENEEAPTPSSLSIHRVVQNISPINEFQILHKTKPDERMVNTSMMANQANVFMPENEEEPRKISIHDVYASMETGKTKREVLAIAKRELKLLQKFYESRLLSITNSCASQIEEIDNQLKERDQIVRDTINQCEKEKEMIKRQWWCSYCQETAEYACCFNISYCSEKCQESDKDHLEICARRKRVTQEIRTVKIEGVKTKPKNQSLLLCNYPNKITEQVRKALNAEPQQPAAVVQANSKAIKKDATTDQMFKIKLINPGSENVVVVKKQPNNTPMKFFRTLPYGNNFSVQAGTKLMKVGNLPTSKTPPKTTNVIVTSSGVKPGIQRAIDTSSNDFSTASIPSGYRVVPTSMVKNLKKVEPVPGPSNANTQQPKKLLKILPKIQKVSLTPRGAIKTLNDDEIANIMNKNHLGDFC